MNYKIFYMFLFSVLILLVTIAIVLLADRRSNQSGIGPFDVKQGDGGYIKIYGGEEVYEESYLIFKMAPNGQMEVFLRTDEGRHPYFYQNNQPVANFKKQISVSDFYDFTGKLTKILSLDTTAVKIEILNQYKVDISLSLPSGRIDKRLDENVFASMEELLDYLDEFVKKIK